MVRSVFDFLSLPARVLCDVLGQQLPLKSLVRLDSVFCYRQRRERWLALISSKHFIFQNEIQIVETSVASWLTRKNVKVSTVVFQKGRDGQNAAEYLQLFGGSVRDVHFVDRPWHQQMTMVALYCKHITVLRLAHITVTHTLRDILWSNPNIHEIWFGHVTSSSSGIFNNLILKRLRLLYLHNVTSTEGFPWHATAHSSSLQTLVVHDSCIKSRVKMAINQNCPSLRSISYNGGNIMVSRLLRNLSLENSHVPDCAVLLFVQGLASLRTFCIRSCPSVTDLSLPHIAQNAGNRLEILHADIKNPESLATVEILNNFAQKCTVLKYLNVNCYENVLCSNRGTSLIVSGCPQLKTLVVNKYTTVRGASRDFVAIVRPSLRILMHDSTTAYDILSMPA